jgi:hypothetical protein
MSEWSLRSFLSRALMARTAAAAACNHAPGLQLMEAAPLPLLRRGALPQSIMGTSYIYI